MIFDLQETENFPTEDLLMMKDRIDLTLNGRKREALARFREENPVLGMALKNEDTYLGFYEIGFGLPSFAINILNRDIQSGWVVERIYNQELVDLLLESNNDREHPIVFYNPQLNTASGENWVDTDLSI